MGLEWWRRMIRRDVFAVVVKLAVLALLVFAVCACKKWSSEPGIAQARALSAEALADIYRGMEQLRLELPAGRGVLERDDPRLPPSIRALDVISVDVGNLDRIVLSGGFDDKAALVFYGLSRPGKKQIKLFPGESVHELLWEEAPPSGASN